jgi:hypothetical protein
MKIIPMEGSWLAVLVDITGNQELLLDILKDNGDFLGRYRAAFPSPRIVFTGGKAYLVKDDGFDLAVKRYSFSFE